MMTSLLYMRGFQLEDSRGIFGMFGEHGMEARVESLSRGGNSGASYHNRRTKRSGNDTCCSMTGCCCVLAM